MPVIHGCFWSIRSLTLKTKQSGYYTENKNISLECRFQGYFFSIVNTSYVVSRSLTFTRRVNHSNTRDVCNVVTSDIPVKRIKCLFLYSMFLQFSPVCRLTTVRLGPVFGFDWVQFRSEDWRGHRRDLRSVPVKQRRVVGILNDRNLYLSSHL